MVSSRIGLKGYAYISNIMNKATRERIQEIVDELKEDCTCDFLLNKRTKCWACKLTNKARKLADKMGVSAGVEE